MWNTLGEQVENNGVCSKCWVVIYHYRLLVKSVEKGGWFYGLFIVCFKVRTWEDGGRGFVGEEDGERFLNVSPTRERPWAWNLVGVASHRFLVAASFAFVGCLCSVLFCPLLWNDIYLFSVFVCLFILMQSSPGSPLLDLYFEL